MANDSVSGESAAQELLTLVSTLSDAVHSPNLRPRQADGNARDEGYIAQLNIVQDLCEASFALGMTVERLVHMRTIWKVIDRAIEEARSGPTRWEDDSKPGKAYFEHQRMCQEAQVAMFAIYQYIYGIEELLDVARIRLSTPLRSELKRVGKIRNDLLVHKKRNRAFLRSFGPGGASPSLEFSFLFGPFPGDVSHVKDTAIVWAKAACFLPSSEQGADNVYERRDLMYRRLALFPPPLRAEVSNLVGQWGVRAETPLELGQLLLQVANEMKR